MKKKKAKKVVVTKAKKKEATARVRVKKGKIFSLKINSKPVDIIENEVIHNTILTPIIIAKKVVPKQIDCLDIDVNVSGGGVMGQAVAAKVGIAKALVEWTKSEELKKAFLDYDRKMLVDDTRRKEPKKYLRKGARARYQKSYR